MYPGAFCRRPVPTKKTSHKSHTVRSPPRSPLLFTHGLAGVSLPPSLSSGRRKKGEMEAFGVIRRVPLKPFLCGGVSSHCLLLPPPPRRRRRPPSPNASRRFPSRQGEGGGGRGGGRGGYTQRRKDGGKAQGMESRGKRRGEAGRGEAAVWLLPLPLYCTTLVDARRCAGTGEQVRRGCHSENRVF